jgi:ethanolamine ammonia-lyase large subunit
LNPGCTWGIPDALVRLAATIRGTTYQFGSVKEVLAKANPPKSGDALAGVGAQDAVERVAGGGGPF